MAEESSPPIASLPVSNVSQKREQLSEANAFFVGLSSVIAIAMLSILVRWGFTSTPGIGDIFLSFAFTVLIMSFGSATGVVVKVLFAAIVFSFLFKLLVRLRNGLWIAVSITAIPLILMSAV